MDAFSAEMLVTELQFLCGRLRMGDRSKIAPLTRYLGISDLPVDIRACDASMTRENKKFASRSPSIDTPTAISVRLSQAPLGSLIRLPRPRLPNLAAPRYDTPRGKCCECGRPSIPGDDVCHTHNSA